MYGTGIPSPYQLLGQGVTALGQGIGSLYNQVTQGQEPRGNQPPRRSLREELTELLAEAMLVLRAPFSFRNACETLCSTIFSTIMEGDE